MAVATSLLAAYALAKGLSSGLKQDEGKGGRAFRQYYALKGLAERDPELFAQTMQESTPEEFRQGRINVPSRNATGLDAEEAMNQVADYYRRQMARQYALESSDINRQFAGAGRYTSGQRLQQLDLARERAALGMGNFLSQTALQRYMQERNLQTQADIAQAQIEAQQGTGRTALVGQAAGNIASILAQNPQYLSWLWGQTTFANQGGIPEPRLTEGQLFY